LLDNRIGDACFSNVNIAFVPDQATLTLEPKYTESGKAFGLGNGGNQYLTISLDPATSDNDVKIFKDYVFNKKPATSQPTFPIRGKQLKEIFPNTDQARCDEVAEIINKYSDKFDINTPLRMAHFLGQIGTETGGLKKLEEETCYRSKERIKEIFGLPKYCDLFEGYESDLTKCDEDKPMPCTPPLTKVTSSMTIKDKYVCTPILIDYTYSCRMGNGPANTKDGSTFLGKGFIHLTGKAQFENISSLWNGDEDNAGNFKDFAGKDIDEITNNLDVAMKASMYYWKKKTLNSLADNGIGEEDIDKLGAKVNGTIYPRLPNAYEIRRDLTKKSHNILTK
jgi:predicted chitinase